MTSDTQAPNWLHLDLKGAIPDEQRFGEWLDYFADCGFNGIVFEYEDRFPWRTWPDTFRPGFDRDGWQRIWDRCAKRGLEVVPLVQMQGHLEWLLKYEQYRLMREHDHITEVCPQHPDVRPRFIDWLDEVIDAHPSLKYLHLGADETWNLASCPRCQEKAQQSDDGNLAVYIEHIAALCAHVSQRGVRPMIWADMFWREKRTDLAARMPEDVILIDWQYSGAGPHATTAQLAQSGREVWGGSAARKNFDIWLTQAPMGERIENVVGWHRQLEAGAVSGLIHTTWGRSASIRPIYAPWEGWLPGFIAGGDPRRWQGHALAEPMAALDRGIAPKDESQIEAAQEALSNVSLDDAMAQRAVAWWRLALTHRSAYAAVIGNLARTQTLLRTAPYVGLDTHVSKVFERSREKIRVMVDEWERQARQYWRDAALSDEEEFFESRAGMLRGLLDRDARDEGALAGEVSNAE